MNKRVRNIPILFYVSPEENALIEQNMALLGTDNRSAFIRKMLIDGQIIKLDLPELKELLSLLRRVSNDFNQLARRVNASGRIYAEDISDMKLSLDKIWDAANRILHSLAVLD